MQTLVIANIIGLVAAVLTSLQHPSHIIYLWGHRDDRAVLRGLSVVAILTTTANSIIWVAYGTSYNALPSALASVGTIVVMSLTVWLLRRAGVWSFPALVCYCTFVAACVAGAAAAPQNVLGATGTTISVVTWLPAALKTIRTRGTTAGLAYPPAMSWIIVASNIAWIIYGVMLDDIWLWAASPVGIASACVMLWTYRYSHRTLREQAPAR